MTKAVLSFTTPGRVTFRCDELGIDERRDIDAYLPFVLWSDAYADGYWTVDALLGVGVAVGRWFDGPQQWLSRLLQGTAPIILTIETDPHPTPAQKAALDAPWELLASVEAGATATPPVGPGPTHDVDAKEPEASRQLTKMLGPVDLRRARHLALAPGVQLTVVRRLGRAITPRPPSKYRLSVVFMSAQPDGMAGLAVEREEVEIRRATGGIGMYLAVEDSGSLERLGELVAQTVDCDVVQLSCHGSMRDRPVLMLEGLQGERVDTTADDLSLSLGEKPRLMFLSACSTARASQELWSLSVDLCARGWPAILGWSCGISDAGAIALAHALYRQLAVLVPLEEALGQARLVLANTATGAEWHKARLFVGPSGGGKIISSTSKRPQWPDFVGGQAFLDPATRKIPLPASDTGFPYRRAFQRVMATVRDGDRSGVVIYGGDVAARAMFAGRVLLRLAPNLRRVVVARDFDASSILEAIRVQTAQADVNAIANEHRDSLRTDPSLLLQAVRAIIEGPCQTGGDGAFVLVLHGFDPEVDVSAQSGDRRRLTALQIPVAEALITAFSGAGTASRLLFTSAAPFLVATRSGEDLADSLLVESLDLKTTESA